MFQPNYNNVINQIIKQITPTAKNGSSHTYINRNWIVKRSRLLAKAMQLPVVLDQIIEELFMSFAIFNLPMRFKRSFNVIGVPLGLHSDTNIVVETWQV